jgi:hypothetical protein
MLTNTEALRLARRRYEEELAGASDPTNDARHQAACSYAASALFAISATTSLDAATCERWAKEERALADRYEREHGWEDKRRFECSYVASVLAGLAHDIRSAS